MLLIFSAAKIQQYHIYILQYVIRFQPLFATSRSPCQQELKEKCAETAPLWIAYVVFLSFFLSFCEKGPFFNLKKCCIKTAATNVKNAPLFSSNYSSNSSSLFTGDRVNSDQDPRYTHKKTMYEVLHYFRLPYLVLTALTTQHAHPERTKDGRVC